MCRRRNFNCLLTEMAASLAFLSIVRALSIDNQLTVIKSDCYERMAIGQRLSPKNVYKTFDHNTVSDCQMACTKEKDICKSFSFGIGAKGNATCELSSDPVKETADLKPIGTIAATDFDLYIKKLGCKLVIEKNPNKFGSPSLKPVQEVSNESYGGPSKPPLNNYGTNQQNRPPNKGDQYDKPPNDYGNRPQNNNGNKDDTYQVQTIVSVASGPQTFLHPIHEILIGDESYGGGSARPQRPIGPPRPGDYDSSPPFRPSHLNHPYENNNGRPDRPRPVDYDRHDSRPRPGEYDRVDRPHPSDYDRPDPSYGMRPERPMRPRPENYDRPLPDKFPRPQQEYDSGGSMRPHEYDRPIPGSNYDSRPMRPDNFNSHSGSRPPVDYDSRPNRPSRPDSSDYDRPSLGSRPPLDYDSRPNRPMRPDSNDYDRPNSRPPLDYDSRPNRPMRPDSNDYDRPNPRPPLDYDSRPNRPIRPGSEYDRPSPEVRPPLDYDTRPNRPLKPDSNNYERPNSGYHYNRPERPGPGLEDYDQRPSHSRPNDYDRPNALYNVRPEYLPSRYGEVRPPSRPSDGYGDRPESGGARPNSERYDDLPPRRPFRPNDYAKPNFDFYEPRPMRPLPDRYGSYIPHPNDYNNRPLDTGYLFRPNEIDRYDDLKPNRKPGYDFDPNVRPVDKGYSEIPSRPSNFGLQSYGEKKPQNRPSYDDKKAPSKPAYSDNGKPGNDSFYGKPDSNNPNKGDSYGNSKGEIGKPFNEKGSSKPIVTQSVGPNGEQITSIITPLDNGGCTQNSCQGQHKSSQNKLANYSIKCFLEINKFLDQSIFVLFLLPLL